MWNVDTNIITFAINPNTSNQIILGECIRNSARDITTANTAKNLTQVDIWKSDQTPVNIYDYGYVYEDIKGKWIEWYEWNRPACWYPTNHVDVSLEIPPDVDYDEFVNEFKKTFYDIASTVLYIHSIINVYNFGYGKNNFGILSAPTYHTVKITLTNNPARQPTMQI